MRGALFMLMLACAERALPLPQDSLTLAEFAEAYGRQVCERERRCGFLDEGELTTCRVYFGGGYQALVDRNYRFDAVSARKCLDGLLALDCLALSFQQCQGVVTPTGAQGQECADDCAHGLRCDQARCPFLCVPEDIVAVGAHCDSKSRCQDGSYCPFPDGACTRIGGAGASCQASLSDQCSDGLFCKPDSGSCQPPGAAGEACFNTAASYQACQQGLVCEGSVFPFGTCVPFVPEGQECFPLEPCAEGLRCSGYSATGVGHCMRPIPEGSPCNPGDECRDFTLCSDGVCTRALPTLGEACDPKRDNCAVGYCDGECRPALPLGAACDPDGSSRQCRIGSCNRATRACARCP